MINRLVRLSMQRQTIPYVSVSFFCLKNYTTLEDAVLSNSQNRHNRLTLLSQRLEATADPNTVANLYTDLYQKSQIEVIFEEELVFLLFFYVNRISQIDNFDTSTVLNRKYKLFSGKPSR